MSITNYCNNRGDTLIEAMFAVAVFSLVAVGAMSIMNQGTATAQRALEITLVRQEIDAQAETLRFLNASFISSPTSAQAGEWGAIRSSIPVGKTNVSAFGSAGIMCPSTPPLNSFILNAKKAKFVSATGLYRMATTYSQVRYNAGGQVNNLDGIWVEAVRVNIVGNDQSNAGYIDFHIRACWDSPGQSAPITLGTIVRLYEPLP